MHHIRKMDFIISFGILFFIMVINIFPPGNLLATILKIILASGMGAIVIGSLTNILFRKK